MKVIFTLMALFFISSSVPKERELQRNDAIKQLYESYYELEGLVKEGKVKKYDLDKLLNSI